MAVPVPTILSLALFFQCVLWNCVALSCLRLDFDFDDDLSTTVCHDFLTAQKILYSLNVDAFDLILWTLTQSTIAFSIQLKIRNKMRRRTRKNR